jgi:glycine reductase
MARELDKAGIPTAHVCTMLNVSKGMGGNRLVPSRSVLHPTGDPELSPGEEYALRHKIVETALHALRAETTEQRVFE